MTAPGENGLLLTLFMPMREDLPYTLKPHWPAGFSPAQEELAAEDSCVRRVKFVDPQNLQGLQRWWKTTVDVAWEGGQQTAWVMMAPPLVNGNFERLAGEYLDYWNIKPEATNPGEGTYCLSVNAQNTKHGHVTVLTPLKPGCRYRFSGMIRRETTDTSASAQVVEYTDERNFVRSATLAPTQAGEWERLSTDFTTHENPRSTAIYLYNFSKTTAAWFDDLRLEEIK
jgi:hypothetical protein